MSQALRKRFDLSQMIGGEPLAGCIDVRRQRPDPRGFDHGPGLAIGLDLARGGPMAECQPNTKAPKLPV